MPRYPEYRMDPNMSEEDRADIQARQAAASQMHTYTSAKERYSEAKSSAWTFLVIGCAGFLAVTAALTGVFHLPLSHFSLLVLDAVFLLFIGIAVLPSCGKAHRRGDRGDGSEHAHPQMGHRQSPSGGADGGSGRQHLRRDEIFSDLGNGTGTAHEGFPGDR